MDKRLPSVPTPAGDRLPAAVTIDDIARVAGVHPASVSRALRGNRSKVSEATRIRIEGIARELGYRPNAVAVSLRTKQTHLAAIVLPPLGLGNPMFAPLVQNLETQLRVHGMMCLVAQMPEGQEGRAELITTLANRQVDGLLVLAAQEDDDPLLAEVLRLRIPTVLVNRGVEERRFPSVVNDDRESARLALQHLQGLGHRAIAHVAGPRESSTGRARRQAFEWFAARDGLHAPVVEASAFTREAGRIATQALFAAETGITAVFAANDLIALGVLDVLHERGLRVPGDVSLVGHNDVPMVDLIDPPLTTVRVDVGEMGRQAAQLFLEHLGTPGLPPSTRVLMPEMVVRKSTGPARPR
jgi:LacI family transcriptional regulator